MSSETFNTLIAFGETSHVIYSPRHALVFFHWITTLAIFPFFAFIYVACFFKSPVG